MEDQTKGVETLLGNPKKAVIAMAIPMIVGMIAQSANNLIDAVWVAGLGADALAAVGFVFPLFFIIIGIGNGIGVGASSAIARHIGRDDKANADKTASQAISLVIVSSLIAMILLLVFQRDILILLGVGQTLDLCIEYSTPIFLFTILFLLNGLFSNLLRAEGASKRSMNTQIVAAVINIILDPLFIYSDVAGQVFGIDLGIKFGLGLGMAGAAWATVIAVAFSFVIMLYWYFVKKDTFIKIRKNDFKFDKAVDYDILRVGIPSSLEMIIMSIFAMVMNAIIVMSDMSTNGVAIYSSAWRLVDILMIPLMAIGGAVVPVLGAAYGGKRFDSMKIAYNYSVKIGFIIMVVLVVITLLTADFLVILFTYSDSTVALRPQMADAVRILSLFLPLASWGFVAVGLFQSIGMGTKSLICTLFRNGLQLPAGYILVTTVGTFISIMWGIVAMEILGSLLAGVWSYALLRDILKRNSPPSEGVSQDSAA